MLPRPLLLALFALAGVPLVAGIFVPGLAALGTWGTFAVFLLGVVDLIVSPRLSRVRVERDAKEVMSLGARNPVTVRLRNENPGPISVLVHDEPPAPSAAPDLPHEIELPPGRTRYFVYHVEPHRRGRSGFGKLFLRCKSRFGLWTLQDERVAVQSVRIFPDIQAVKGIELLARRNRLAEAGVRLSRLRGRGTDFDRLREYRREDEFRSIDWKATARHQELVSREYAVEKNQNLLLLLDCGRSMCNETDGISHFDRALNAALVLGYVALRQGDTVGILACSNRVERWAPPVRGMGSIQKLIRQVYDLEPTYEASDYELMIENVRRRYRKRSLVMLVTHALDEVHLAAIASRIKQLRTPHLVLTAFLRNVPLEDRLNAVPETDLEAFQVAAAAELVAAQSRQVAQLEKAGLLVVETLPEQLSADLVTRYLDIKARHLL